MDTHELVIAKFPALSCFLARSYVISYILIRGTFSKGK